LKETGQLDEAQRVLEAAPVKFRNRPDFRLRIMDHAGSTNPFALSNPGIDTCLAMTEAPCIAYSLPEAQGSPTHGFRITLFEVSNQSEAVQRSDTRRSIRPTRAAPR
jgi:hypothetical protein